MAGSYGMALDVRRWDTADGVSGKRQPKSAALVRADERGKVQGMFMQPLEVE